MLVIIQHTFVYDYNNKLVSADNNASTYKYDALGRRIAKNNALFFFRKHQMIEEISSGSTMSYIYGNRMDEILYRNSEMTDVYYHTNHLNTTLAITDSHAIVLETILYDLYGAPIFVTNNKEEKVSSIHNTILYTGREFDYESGLFFYRSRVMNSSIGRFIQKDMEGYINGLNDYSYVKNCPSMFIDPFGFAHRGRAPLRFLEKIIGKENAQKAANWSMNQKWMDDHNIGLYHEQWFYEDESNNIGYGDNPHRMTEEDPSRYTMLDEYYPDEDLRDAADKLKPEDYGDYALTPTPWSKGHNCQNWAEDIQKELEKKKRQRSGCDKNRPFCEYYPTLCEDGFCDENPAYCKMREMDIGLGKAWVNRR